MLHSLNERIILEQTERQERLLVQMDSLYIGSVELNERMNSMVSEFERENNERFLLNATGPSSLSGTTPTIW